jgi:hypothetical protein
VNGSAPSEVLTFFLEVSPGWLDAMRIGMVDGRDFRENDTEPSVVIVNEAFAKQYFSGRSPVGQSFDTSNRHRRILGGGHFRTNDTHKIKTVELEQDAQLTWTYEYAGSLELGSTEGRGEVSRWIVGIGYVDRSHAVETLVEAGDSDGHKNRPQGRHAF